ncbi:FRG domain-containing protein [Ralstonia sp. CHL-2022]|uniref:FRG domain-containing protein n=1 Tax=Ralstonia mojiangensis TaxID=2953895 RepID=A0ABT2L5V4_9RALS|nr:FRG domain-containing protein [Ralstonia mojiangensis]MCT7310089.1 FRG domain-containing protein [Ralstonia mojiangensis]
MKIIRAANVEEAVAIATQLQQDGKYDWFRGQVQEWPPCSSLERRIRDAPEIKSQLDKKLERFIAWAKAQIDLEYLANPNNVDALFAVLQHYGFPTSYIDFSTDPCVAGFFASDCKTPPDPSSNSVIYCLNTADFSEFYSTVNIKQDGMPIIAETVTVDVSNLWRLQAQRGCFVFANHPWYRLYDMDRIVFPWTGYPAYPPKEQIYPLHKSRLEQLLDQYFFLERTVEASEIFEAQQKEAQAKGGGFKVITVASPIKYSEEYFSSPLEILPQWTDETLVDWQCKTVEDFDTTVGRHIPIRLRASESGTHVGQQISQGILSALKRQPQLRREAVDWVFTGLPAEVDQELFATTVRDAWNGMRNLPYTDEDIAAAVNSLLTLSSLPECGSVDGTAVHKAFMQWLPDAIEVEFGVADGSYSRGYCSDSRLLKSIHTNWTLKLSNLENISSAAEALRRTYDPRLIFNFTELAQLFAREVIPSQLVRRRPVILFNPADLDVFGLP